VLVASAAALVVGAAPAHADSVTTVGYYTDNLDHGGNAALGRVKFEAWIIQLRNAFWYRCANGTLGACGSVSQSIPA
jgi:hypothetical protein